MDAYVLESMKISIYYERTKIQMMQYLCYNLISNLFSLIIWLKLRYSTSKDIKLSITKVYQ